ncbi:MAG: DNA/RNA nuclease SfsA [Eubacteriales bacterium]|jgi:sugar fermentation stimulation protein A
MYYPNIFPATFLQRPNRFIAHCLIEDQEIICHVKNTGRCRELLIPGCRVYVQHCPSPQRKTQYDLIAVQKGSRLINMDSAAPNRLFVEALRQGTVPLEALQNLTCVRQEQTFGESRLDFYVEQGNRRGYGELKGVTLEEEGIAYFPDAPTQRGVRHIHTLMETARQGLDAYLIFIVQMENILCLRPNDRTHPAFGEAMREAARAGVSIHAFTCTVTPDTLTLAQSIPIEL